MPPDAKIELTNEIYSYDDDEVWQCPTNCQLTVFYTLDCCLVRKTFADSNTRVYWFQSEQKTEIYRPEEADNQVFEMFLPFNITEQRLQQLVAFL